MRRLLLVDQTPDCFEKLLPVLTERYDVRICCNGKELMQELLAFRPELMVLDLSIPDCDSLGHLRVARALDICPRVLAISYSSTDGMIGLLTEGIITFLLIKPFEQEDLVKRISDMERLLSKSREERLYTLTGGSLQELGLKPSRTGFRCLKEAALYLFDHENCLFTDELYPYVAKSVKGTAASVEKAMSRSIESAWKKRNDPLWQYYFGSTDLCPTNVRFLKTLVNAIKEAF